ncbi:MAG: DUF3800 domain-containing protein [Acidobacteriia bacterium]|nr:DUF3800 domain-containing protein [Terriglobia bacterium]
MLQGYVDDSGSHESRDSRHFVLAGYVMQSSLWEQFSDKWANELHREPSVKLFKMADAESGDGVFTGMREEFRRLKVKELAEIIAEFWDFSLAVWCHLDWQDYREIVRGKVHPKVDSPYAILFYQIMRGAHEHQIELNKRLDVGFHTVDFIFDEQGFSGLRAVQWFAELTKKLPPPYDSMIGATPIFRKDEEYVGLQAADMLAWHVRRNLERPDEKRPIFELITNGFTGELKVTREHLSQFVELIGKIDRTLLDAAF